MKPMCQASGRIQQTLHRIGFGLAYFFGLDLRPTLLINEEPGGGLKDDD